MTCWCCLLVVLLGGAVAALADTESSGSEHTVALNQYCIIFHFLVPSFRDELEVFQDISNGDNIVEGDIELSPEEVELFNKTGSFDGLVNSQAWRKGIRKWPREIKYEVTDEIGKNIFLAKSRAFILFSGPELRKAIKFSIKLFETYTCLRFKQSKMGQRMIFVPGKG